VLTLFVTHNFLEDMALVMCVAALATVICQLLHQPLVVGYLVAGMVVGPNVPGVYANTERVQLVADLGVTLLVFSIGLEFKFRRLMRLAPTAGLVALIQIASMLSLGYLVGRLMGWTPWESLLTGAMVSISGAVIVAKAFEEVRVDSRVRELVFGVVLCEDVVAILLLAVLITMANGGAESLDAFSITAGLLSSFIIVLIAIGLITVPYVVRGVARFKRPETLLITSLGLCFAFATIAERAGYTVALGAFLAGSLVAESGQGAEVEKLIEPVRHIFGAIFFVSVGMHHRAAAASKALACAGGAQRRGRRGQDHQRLVSLDRGGLRHNRLRVPISDPGVQSGGGLGRPPSPHAGPERAFSIWRMVGPNPQTPGTRGLSEAKPALSEAKGRLAA
jgi:CPA2 family monovalent cation:H+ antiporter-2